MDPCVVVTVLHTMERRREVVNSVRASFLFIHVTTTLLNPLAAKPLRLRFS
jgi:hypothetical protein